MNINTMKGLRSISVTLGFWLGFGYNLGYEISIFIIDLIKIIFGLPVG